MRSRRAAARARPRGARAPEPRDGNHGLAVRRVGNRAPRDESVVRTPIFLPVPVPVPVRVPAHVPDVHLAVERARGDHRGVHRVPRHALQARVRLERMVRLPRVHVFSPQVPDAQRPRRVAPARDVEAPVRHRDRVAAPVPAQPGGHQVAPEPLVARRTGVGFRPRRRPRVQRVHALGPQASAGVVLVPRGGGAPRVVVEGVALLVLSERVLHLRHRRLEKREQTRPGRRREPVDGHLAHLARRRASVGLNAALGYAVRLDPVVESGAGGVRRARVRVRRSARFAGDGGEGAPRPVV